jgi:uncharacterized membrane protein YdfJ with MMPL/SSD domain
LSSNLTKQQRKRLIDAYDEYVNGRFNQLSVFIITIVGFCLGTLSSSRIPIIANVIIMAIIAITFLILIKKEEKKKCVKLYKEIASLKQEYKNKDNNTETIEEIESYNIWKSTGTKAFKTTSLLVVGALFLLYTVVEHVLRLEPVYKYVFG